MPDQVHLKSGWNKLFLAYGIAFVLLATGVFLSSEFNPISLAASEQVNAIFSYVAKIGMIIAGGLLIWSAVIARRSMRQEQGGWTLFLISGVLTPLILTILPVILIFVGLLFSGD